MPVAPHNLLARAWYAEPIDQFLTTGSDAILGRLTGNSNVDVVQEQVEAWQVQISLLKQWLQGLDGSVLLEFNIPRMGRRIDAVVLLGAVVLVVEFKVGAATFDRGAINQVWDYALDLKNFHEASHSVHIVPMLVPTEAKSSSRGSLEIAEDLVAKPLCTHPDGFRSAIEYVVAAVQGDRIDNPSWIRAPYRPTPTIVEAARVLYARHSVEEIARHDAGAQNLAITSRRIEELVEQAKAGRQKIICFVTGVPGAGKTLVGLNVATQRRDVGAAAHAVFLSGNGPLVAVLREALTRDELMRRKRDGEKVTKAGVASPVKAFIQNVHHFRDEALREVAPPADHIVIFDEAQRAWNRQKTASFMKQKKGQPNFQHSEPAFLISYMDRHDDWAVIVCLVGGGQEIHTGEAGIGEWLEAVKNDFPHWRLFVSDRLVDSEYAAGRAMESIQEFRNANLDGSLHLAVSMRSFRAENVSAFVKAMLDCDQVAAQQKLKTLSGKFPIVVTRDLMRAKQWVRDRARGTERFGLVASSRALRLKPHAIDIRTPIDPVHWFLDDCDDTRSSYYLEDCATEFQVQGLELDWICVSWDGDLRFKNDNWSYHDFRGNRWQNVQNQDNRNYLRNAYRVLLTRARQGMVIFVPRGDPTDPTRAPILYDRTFDYLVSLGISTVQ